MHENSGLPQRLSAEQRQQARIILGDSEVALISCLFWWMDIRDVIPVRRLADSFLYVPVKGRLWYRVAEHEGVIGRGQCLLVGEGVEHEARLPADCRRFEAFALHAHAYTTPGQPLFSLFATPVGRLQPVGAWLEQLELLTHLLGTDQELGRRFGEPWLRSLLLHLLLQGAPLAARRSTAADARLWQAVRDISEQYAGTLTVRELARRAGVSTVQFRVLFKRYTGSRPKAYIQQFRLRKARALLQTNPLLTIKEAAEQTGFGDAHYFHNVFRRAYGQTPTACRHRSQRA